MYHQYALITALILSLSQTAMASEIQAKKVAEDLSKTAFNEALWNGVKEESVSLMAQPMALPRPLKAETQLVKVQAIHDGQWIAFRLRWRSGKKNEAGKLGQFSDAVALQFPVKEESQPPIFMGAKDNPVHIFHWRAQYQRDIEKGKPEMKTLYPNMNPDMYPMEFKDSGNIQGLNDEKREVYSPGKSEGNPQSYVKESAVDEVYAEGFGSSSVIQNRMAVGHGVWSHGEWSVVIARPMNRENGSVLKAGKNSYMAFAVWQGAKQEVGSRKSITMSWVPLSINGQ